MRKIPTIFLRNPNNLSEALDSPNPECAWVFKGEGTATRKYDGTCCLIENDVLWKRREIKPGGAKPEGFRSEGVDLVTGKEVGWVLVGQGEEDQWHRAAVQNMHNWPDGTYELCGPKVQGNPEKFDRHLLIRHADAPILPDFPRDFEGIRAYLMYAENLGHFHMEGVVFHHPGGGMAKIKKRDFGLPR